MRATKYLIGLALIGGLYWSGPMLMDGLVRANINSSFSNLGFPNPRFDLTSLTWSGLRLENIQLEPEGISTIDTIDVSFSPLGLLWGRVNNVHIVHPDLIYSSDDPPSTGANPLDILTTFSLQSLPLTSMKIDDLNISYAGDDFNPSIGGKIDMLTDDNGDRKLVMKLDSEQPELTLKLNGIFTETRAREKTLALEIPEARFDIPNLRMSRANGKITLRSTSQTPLAIQGELSAGALKIGTLPLDGLTVIANGAKPDLSVIANAAVTGVPMTNLSLRISEDAKGARLVVQLSGEQPQGLLDRLWPGKDVAFTQQQKYALTLDLADPTIMTLLHGPYQGGLFLYLDPNDPVIKASIACTTGIFDCVVKMPPTNLNAARIGMIAAPLLENNNVVLKGGTLRIGGLIKTSKDDANELHVANNLELTTKNLSASWQTLNLDQMAFNMTRQNDETTTIDQAQARVLKGALSFDRLTLSPRGDGALKLNLKSIDLNELSKIANVSGLKMSGVVDGSIPLTLKNGILTAGVDARLSSSNGNIQYAPSSYPTFLTGDDDRMNILRQALQDYAFNELSLNFSGVLTGVLKAQLAAKGRSQALFGDRPIHINLNIDGPLAPALQRLLPTFSHQEPTAP